MSFSKAKSDFFPPQRFRKKKEKESMGKLGGNFPEETTKCLLSKRHPAEQALFLVSQ